MGDFCNSLSKIKYSSQLNFEQHNLSNKSVNLKSCGKLWVIFSLYQLFDNYSNIHQKKENGESTAKIERLLIDVVSADETMHWRVFHVHHRSSHLIDINSWGCFASAGSSLFHWVKNQLDDFGSAIDDESVVRFRNVDLYNMKKLLHR